MTDLQIEAFLSICRHKSISKAAEALYISQSSLSTRLKTLEDSLGCALLLRAKGTREIALTAQGEAFYGLALQHQAILRKMENVRSSEPAETLRVSAIHSVSSYLLPSVFQRFVRDWPAVRLSIQDMEAEAACRSLIRGTTDLAFSTSKIQTERIVSTPFLEDPLVLLCTEDAVFSETADLSELSAADEIYIRLCADQEYWHESTFGTAALPKVRVEVMEQLRLFLTGPKDWAMVPQSVADHLTKQPGLKQCRPAFPVPSRSIFVLRSRDSADAPYVLRFLETAETVLREEKRPGLLLQSSSNKGANL